MCKSLKYLHLITGVLGIVCPGGLMPMKVRVSDPLWGPVTSCCELGNKFGFLESSVHVLND